MHKKLFIVVFFIMICLPSLGMLFYKTDIKSEKRKIQAFPKLTIDREINKKYFEQMQNYFSENFAFRQELIAADGVIKSGIFKDSNNDKVIVGKDGWLFFRETVDDYIGKNTLSDREIYCCGRILYLIQQNALKNKKKFLFVAAPNKNSIYPEYMPKRYIKISEKNNYLLLQEELKRQKVNTIDLQSLFHAEKDIVYHKLDTHWNNEGAAMACGWILNNLKKEHYNYGSEEKRIENNFSGDLYEMLFPKGSRKDDNVIYKRPHLYKTVSKSKNMEDIFIKTENQKKKDSIVMYRDSFGNALIPYIADEYKWGYFTKAIPYNMELTDSYAADAVVIELAERNIPTLISEIPYMEAPMQNALPNVEKVSRCTSSLKIAEGEDGYLSLKGVVDKRYIDDCGQIFVRLYNKKYQYVFEAFPGAFNGENTVGYNYGLYINLSVCKEGIYNVEVVTQKGKKYYTPGSKLKLEIEE